jgi:hypothetical protein
MRAVFAMSRFRPFSAVITSRKNGWLYGHSDDEYDVYRPLHMALDGWLYASHSFGQVRTSGKSVFNAINKSGYLLPEIDRNSATLKQSPTGAGSMFPIDAIAGDDKLVFFRPGSPPPGAGAFFFSARSLILDFGGQIGEDLLGNYRRTLEKVMSDFGIPYRDWVNERQRPMYRELELLEREFPVGPERNALRQEISDKFDTDLRWAILDLPQEIIDEFYVRVQKIRNEMRFGGTKAANFVDSLVAQQAVGYPEAVNNYAERYEITVEGRVPIDAAFGWMYAVNDDRDSWEFGFREEFYPYYEYVELLDRAIAAGRKPGVYFLDDVVQI